ncbi:hypothetical protein GCM10028805_25270 [Spirosoma harenae]
MQLNFLYTYCVHTELVRKLWLPIEYIFVTPSHHRVHHASDEVYLDANFGEVLIVWDRLFGTFVEEGRQPTYGLMNPVSADNPISLAFHEWVAIGRDIRKANSYKQVLKYLFAPPGWTSGSQSKRDD